MNSLNKNYSNLIKINDLELDLEHFVVTRGNKMIKLTHQEFKIFEYMVQNQNKVLSREMILSKIWKYSKGVQTRVVDVYIGYLRKKIDKDNPTKLIHSLRGYGYILKTG